MLLKGLTNHRVHLHSNFHNPFVYRVDPVFLKVLRDFSRPHWVDIVQQIKGSPGLSVAELARRLKMSYMGVKQHCVDLEKKGYLDTWRRPKPMGRPEKAYRLTAKCAPLFPELGLAFAAELLENVRRNHGDTAPDKALFQYFQAQAERYAAKVKGETPEELAKSFAKLRNAGNSHCGCTDVQLSESSESSDMLHTGVRHVRFRCPGANRNRAAVQSIDKCVTSRIAGGRRNLEV